MCLRGAQASAGAHPLERARRPEEPRNEVRAAGVGNEPDVDERRYEGCGVGGDADVARTGDRKAGARGRAVDGRDHGLLETADREHVPVVAGAKAVADVPRRLAKLGQILADAEGPPCAGEHDGPHLRVAGVAQRRRECGVHGGVEGIQDIGPVQRDRQDGAVALGLDLCHLRGLSQIDRPNMHSSTQGRLADAARSGDRRRNEVGTNAARTCEPPPDSVLVGTFARPPKGVLAATVPARHSRFGRC